MERYEQLVTFHRHLAACQTDHGLYVKLLLSVAHLSVTCHVLTAYIIRAGRLEQHLQVTVAEVSCSLQVAGGLVWTKWNDAMPSQKQTMKFDTQVLQVDMPETPKQGNSICKRPCR